MIRFWRLASGLAIILQSLFAGVSLVLNISLGEPMPSFAYRVVLPIVACIVILFSFVGSYLLLKDARNSK
jgi:hypothetical protein